MKCLDCQSELERVDAKGISLNQCPKCGGAWFERDELRRAKDSADENLRWLDFDPFAEEADKFHVSAAKRPCPSCSEPMSSLTYKNSGVVIEKCTKCHGIWLDGGEFEKIIRYLENLIVTKHLSEYQQDAEKQLKEVFTGPESFVSELRDFFAVCRLLELRAMVEQARGITIVQNILMHSPFK